jgi:hypothetical protein
MWGVLREKCTQTDSPGKRIQLRLSSDLFLDTLLWKNAQTTGNKRFRGLRQLNIAQIHSRVEEKRITVFCLNVQNATRFWQKERGLKK